MLLANKMQTLITVFTCSTGGYACSNIFGSTI